MYREVRRKDREITKEEAMLLLKNCEYGILATVGSDNVPYAVPMNYVLDNNVIYVHAARDGHKIDNMKANPRVSFTVVGETEPVHEGNDYSTFYESAMAFGKARFVEDMNELKSSLHTLTAKYFPNGMDEFEKVLANYDLSKLSVIAVDIEHVSGKAKRK